VPRAVEERRCPRCGTPAGDEQEYCLECGLRLPSGASLIARLGSSWRRRLGWYPGDWVWPTLLALVVAAGAGVVSAVWLADRTSSATPTLVETSPAASNFEQTQTAPEPTTPTTETTLTAPTTGPKPPPPPARRPIPWPAGKSGWTIVLASLPSSDGRVPALAQARQAIGVGMKQVGVLDSSKFSSLHPGYYVVFSGIYSSEAEAQSAVIDAHGRDYRFAYARSISP
jgi:hypothetical protein